MCNKLHSDSTPIPKEGEGWKFFTTDKNDPKKLLPLVDYQREYENKTAHSINFIKNFNDGFCFVFEKPSNDVIRYIKNVFSSKRAGKKVVFRKIRYSKGIGKHTEKRFISLCDIEMALAGTIELCKNSIRNGEHF